jgi:hypothetical protein
MYPDTVNELACGIGDLQKGERLVCIPFVELEGIDPQLSYLNMDYIVFSALTFASATDLKTINLSYDIACQYHKRVWIRIATLPPPLRLNWEGKTINFFVPKFHLPAHVEVCQTEFSFNWAPGVGCTDGESLERGWANINRVATSTKEMGPGTRRDTIDDHLRDSNWKKNTALGNYIHSCLTVLLI